MHERFEYSAMRRFSCFWGGRPVLATDPWLVGNCYFGSWALDHALTPEQISNVINSDYIWISHGHPDHLHHEFGRICSRKAGRCLLPDHFDPEIRDAMTEKGFAVTILPYRKWVDLRPGLSVMCLDNINQDSILIARLGDALVIDLNDLPFAGELSYLRRLVRQHPNDKTYLAALCSIDADMFNFIDSEGRSIVGPPEERKPGTIWNVARLADSIGVKNFCCSSTSPAPTATSKSSPVFGSTTGL